MSAVLRASTAEAPHPFLELLPLLLKGLSSSIGNAYLRYPSQLVLKAPTTACARSSDDDGGEAYVGGGASSCLFGRSTGVFDGRADTSDKMPLPSAKDVRCIMTKRLLFTDVCGSKDDLYECVEQTWSTFRPLDTHYSFPRFNQVTRGLVTIQSLRIGRGHYAPSPSNHSLYQTKLFMRVSYSEENFGGNQLLDSSISLSPLCPDLTIDLHVRSASALLQSVLWLQPARE